MNYIKGFDGLRAISIILVILTHLGIFDNITGIFFTTRILPLIDGGTGVNIFFSISGFLITWILLEEKTKNKLLLKNFYIRRFLRLLPPLLIFYAIIILLIITKQIGGAYIGLLFSFFYLYNFIPNTFYTGELGHTWSLGVEEQFYLFWPLIILIGKNKKRIILIAVIIIILSIIFTYILPNIEFTYHNKIHGLSTSFKTNRWFIPAVGPIMIGAIFSVLAYNSRDFFNRYFKNNTPLFVFIILFLSPLYIPNTLLPITFLLQAVGITLFLVWIKHNQHHLFTNILEFKPLAYVGKISYGLYVYQGIFLRTGPGYEKTNITQYFPLNLILSIVIAIISYELVEKRILKLKSRFR